MPCVDTLDHAVDAHCHLDVEDFAADRDAVFERAHRVGVRGFVVAGVGPEAWGAQRTLAARPGVKWTAGLHPVAVADGADVDAALAALPQAFVGAHAAVGVGETGLDRRAAHAPTLDRQEAAFRAHLAFARERNLPVVLHLVACYAPALDLLRRDGLPPAGGMVHAWSGGPELVRDFCALGLHLSVAGLVAHPRSRRLRAAAAAIPFDRLLIETDAPDMAPPDLPRRNEPAFLPAIAAAVAAARGCTAHAVIVSTAANAARLFGPF